MHIEFQATTPIEMPWRMLNYRVAINCSNNEWKKPPTPIRQVVIYLRPKTINNGVKLRHHKLGFDYEETTIEKLVEHFEFDTKQHGFHLNLMILLGAGTPNQRHWRDLYRVACQMQSLEQRSDAVVMLEVLSELVKQRDFVRKELKKMPVTLNIRNTVYGEDIYDAGYNAGNDVGQRQVLEAILTRAIYRQNINAAALEEIRTLELPALHELEELISEGISFWDAVENLGLNSAFSK
jgi:hypothetical protein